MKNKFVARVLVSTFIGLLAVVLAGCNTVPVTGRSQFNIMSTGEEAQLGLTSFDQLKKETPISKDPAANALVQKVGKRIAAVAGGKVGVYTGILPITKDEAGLATVIGHEVAHAVARHGGERMSEATALQMGGSILGASLSKSDPTVLAAVNTAYGVGSQVGVALPHSRAQESEADHIGLIYMAEAGYDPRAAVAFWQRFADYNKQQGGDTPAFLRTHPTDAKRIQQLEVWMPAALAQYHPAP